MENKEFYRRTVKVGNSAGVLLPKSLLGAEVKVSVINMPHNLKKDALRILEPILENIIGIYIIKQEFESNKESSKKQEKSEKNRNKKTEILAVSTNIQKHFEKDNYVFDIVPLNQIKKSAKEKTQVKEKLQNAKPII
ncbi:MAG TPA: hypothetical protein VI815_02140, partial [Candidatus Nanoarchaeia archaeon]|nr:hypothetical protein [Candidatus Nanoarchaeia archaeon]